MVKSADGDDDRRRGPVTLLTPDLHDDGDDDGVTVHTMDRYRQRADRPDLAAVRRAWALGSDVPPVSVGLQADAIRYDPQTDLLLLRRCGCIVSVVTLDEWQRAVLGERGWSE